MQRTRYQQLRADVASIGATPVVIAAISQSLAAPGAYDFEFVTWNLNSDAAANSYGMQLGYTGSVTLIACEVLINTATTGGTVFPNVQAVGTRFASPNSIITPYQMTIRGRIVVASPGVLSLARDRLTSGTCTVLAGSSSTLTQLG